jgi:hypothetical protein
VDRGRAGAQGDGGALRRGSDIGSDARALGRRRIAGEQGQECSPVSAPVASSITELIIAVAKPMGPPNVAPPIIRAEGAIV